MDERPTKRRGPLLWLAARSRRFRIIAVLCVVLPILYPLAYGPWIYIRCRWFRDAQGAANFRHPIWAPLYFFEKYIAQLPEPYWGNYQRLWILPPPPKGPQPDSPTVP